MDKTSEIVFLAILGYIFLGMFFSSGKDKKLAIFLVAIYLCIAFYAIFQYKYSNEDLVCTENIFTKKISCRQKNSDSEDVDYTEGIW